MIRRVPLRLSMLVATAAVGLSACATFTDTNVAARVGDAELTHDQLDELRSATVAEFGQVNNGEANRFITQAFVLVETIHADLDTLGVIAPDRTEAVTLDDYQAQLQAAGALWQSIPAEELADGLVEDVYTSGAADIVCSAHVLTETEAEAVAVLERIQSGEAFGAVAAEVSLDPGSGANGGQLGCLRSAEFAATFVPEFVDGAADLQIGDVSEPVESQFGFHVITKVPFADLGSADIFPLRVLSFGERYDIYVDPTIGEWVGDGSIAPLG